MLEKTETGIVFHCDGCGDSLETEEEDFSMAHEVRKAMEWICYKDPREGWVHYCPSCKEDNR